LTPGTGGCSPPTRNLASRALTLTAPSRLRSATSARPAGASAGGTALNPVCEHGKPFNISKNKTGKPYLLIAPSSGCAENEGAYPAAGIQSDSLYVAYEFNWATNVFGCSVPTTDNITYTPHSCLVLKPVSPCLGPAATNSQTIVSMDAAFVPGYNRFPANDFPRISASDTKGVVAMVWNDAGVHPLGDIYLESFQEVTLTPVQGSPVRLNTDTSGGLKFLPATRDANASGNIDVSWYCRSDPTTTQTGTCGATNVNPLTTSTPATNVTVSDTTNNWLGTSSDIVPNFGDYTDNYVQATEFGPFTTHQDYVAWSDGRLGEPQPFESNAKDHT
jgi:hypothetical protein